MISKINVKPSDFTRIKNDVYGNPRYVIHFLRLLPRQGYYSKLDVCKSYDTVLKINKKLGLGGKKFHNKQYGGGLVFQSYSLPHTCNSINSILNKFYKKSKK